MKTIVFPMFALLVLLTGALAASPQIPSGGAVLDSVRIVGAPADAGDLSGALLSRSGGPMNEGLAAHDRITLTGLLRERGWWNGSTEAFVDSSMGVRVLVFQVSPGMLARFGTVRIEADSGNGTGTVKGFTGAPFTRGTLDSLAIGIVSALAAKGFPDAEAVPSLTARGDSIDVTLRVHPGLRATVDSIAVRGLTVTKDRIIRRELAALKGKTVTPELLAEARTALERIGFVRVDADPSVEYTSGGAVLAVRLSEGSRGSFDGAIGYQPSNDGGSGEMVGKADVVVRNLFGTGRSARLVWENLGFGSEDMEFRWDEPWVFGLPADAYASFAQERRDSEKYTRTLLTAGFGRSLGRLHISAGVRREHVSADTLTSAVATGVEASANWTSLDVPANPRSGFRASAAWSALRKEYLQGRLGKTALIRTELAFDHYIPTIRNQTAAVLLSYRSVDSGEDVPDSADRLWIGGASTLRGYREKLFPADRVFLASFEYRVLTGKASRVFAFTDIGYLRNHESEGDLVVTSTITRVGYGFGLRIQSHAGMLGFDYGLGRGDSLGEGKLHVRLTTEF